MKILCSWEKCLSSSRKIGILCSRWYGCAVGDDKATINSNIRLCNMWSNFCWPPSGCLMQCTTIQKPSPLHGTDTSRYTAIHTKKKPRTIMIGRTQHVKQKTYAIYVHLSGKIHQTFTNKPTNVNVVKCQKMKPFYLTFQFTFLKHQMAQKTHIIISTFGVSRPAHLNSKIA